MDIVSTHIIEVGGVATALVAIWLVVHRVVSPLVRAIRKLHYFLDDWFGTAARPGVPQRMGVMARLDAIEHELHPNSSLSMRDAVDRIERAIHDGNLLAAVASAPPVTVQVAPPAGLGGSVVDDGHGGEEGQPQGEA